MTEFEVYVRVLTELSPVHERRMAQMARVKLQDVLVELRNRAARERADTVGQDTQDTAEAMATGAAYAQPLDR